MVMMKDNSARARRVGVHSSNATSKLIRDITESLQNGNSDEVLALSTLLKPGINQATPDIEELLKTLRDTITVPCQKNRNAALKVTTRIIRHLPPHTLATHALPLIRALKTVPCTTSVALCIASITTGIAPLRHTGGTLVSAVVDMALSRLNDAPLYSSLTIALAALAAAPSLVRPKINMIQDIIWNTGLHRTCVETRRVSALLAARLVAAHSQKARPAAATKCVEKAITGLIAIIQVLQRYSYQPPPERPIEEETLHQLDEDAITARFHSLCLILLNALTPTVSVTLQMPISRIIDTLTSVLVITDVDALASPKHAPTLTPERVLAILPQIHATALDTISKLLTNVHSPAISLPLAQHVAKSLTDSLLDFTSAENAAFHETLSGMSIRLHLYNTIATVACVSPSSGLDMARALSVALNTDVSILHRLRRVRKSTLASTVADSTALGGTARKRRRAQSGGATVSAALKLSNAPIADMVGEEALRCVKLTTSAGANAASAILSGGAIADTRGRAALKAVETALAKLAAIGSLEVLSAPLLVGGSGASRGRACPLLSDSITAVTRAKHVGKCSTNTFAAIDAILHPRASPVVRMPAASRNTSGNVPSASLRFRSKPIITPVPTPMEMTTTVKLVTPSITPLMDVTETPSAMEIETGNTTTTTTSSMQDKPEKESGSKNEVSDNSTATPDSRNNKIEMEASPKKKVRFTEELVTELGEKVKESESAGVGSEEGNGNDTSNEQNVSKPQIIHEPTVIEVEKTIEVSNNSTPSEKEGENEIPEVVQKTNEAKESGTKKSSEEIELGDEAEIVNSLCFEASDDEQQ